MRLCTLGVASAAGIAVFLLVTVAVTELALPSVAFSVLLGLPVVPVRTGVIGPYSP